MVGTVPRPRQGSNPQLSLSLRQRLEVVGHGLHLGGAQVPGDAVHDRVSALCLAAAVDGVRADLVMLRAARALAAWQGAADIGTTHVDAVAELVLHHRRHAGAPPQSGRAPAPTPEPQAGAAADPWGALPPPQAAGMAEVSPLKPFGTLPPKKA